MIHSRVAKAATLAAVPLLVSCNQLGPNPKAGTVEQYRTSASAAHSVQSVGGSQVSEAVAFRAMVTLARSVAVSLADDSVRALVDRSLRESPFRENKIHFRTFTDGGGAAVLAGGYQTAGRSLQEMRATRDSAIDLEFYMPVKAHRSEWTGGKDLLVATTFDVDDDIPIAFDLAGRQVPLNSAEVPPATPTLVLVRVETDFSRGPQPTECDPGTIYCGDGGGGGSPPPPAPGIHMEFSYIADDHEGFGGGDPEYEIFPAYATTDTLTARFNQCVGANAGNAGRSGTDLGTGRPGIVSNLYSFDQNNSTWTGRVLLLSQTQIDAATAMDSTLTYWVFEDDNTSCVLKFGGSGDADAYKAGVALRATNGRLGVRNRWQQPQDPFTVAWQFVRSLVGMLIDNSKDDIVGMMVRKEEVGETWSDANMALIDKYGLTAGRANLVKY